MDQYFELGKQLRSLLRGLFDGEPAPSPDESKGTGASASWGPEINVSALDDLFHPQVVKQYAVAPAGVDNLALTSIDKFLIPGRGEYTVNFDGMMRIAREEPATQNWANANVFVNMVEMNLTASHPDLGKITVKRNPAVVSPGQTFAPGAASAPAACRIGAGVMFEAPNLGVTLFNKEPILLMNDSIHSIPPIEDPNGAAHIYRLPLYDAQKPDGRPVAYLTSLRYSIGNYLTQAQAAAYRVQ